jgi:uncharacterized membrane protein YgdD (TMEM256/DUF423 family)
MGEVARSDGPAANAASISREGRVWLAVGSLSAFLAVAAGTFGADGIQGKPEDRFSEAPLGFLRAALTLACFYETAVSYQIFHALGLLCVGLLVARAPSLLTRLAGAAFLAGTLLFSGSLYCLALTGVTWLGAVTPLGALAFLLGWLLLAGAALGGSRR